MGLGQGTRHPDHPAPTPATTSIEMNTNAAISAVNTVERAVPISAGFSWEQLIYVYMSTTPCPMCICMDVHIYIYVYIYMYM